MEEPKNFIRNYLTENIRPKWFHRVILPDVQRPDSLAAINCFGALKRIKNLLIPFRKYLILILEPDKNSTQKKKERCKPMFFLNTNFKKH